MGKSKNTDVRAVSLRMFYLLDKVRVFDGKRSRVTVGKSGAQK